MAVLKCRCTKGRCHNPHRLMPKWRGFSHHWRDTAHRPPKAYSRGVHGPAPFPRTDIMSDHRNAVRQTWVGGAKKEALCQQLQGVFSGNISIHRAPHDGLHADKCAQKPIHAQRPLRRGMCGKANWRTFQMLLSFDQFDKSTAPHGGFSVGGFGANRGRSGF